MEYKSVGKIIKFFANDSAIFRIMSGGCWISKELDEQTYGLVFKEKFAEQK
jgi:hypothetical protein